MPSAASYLIISSITFLFLVIWLQIKRYYIRKKYSLLKEQYDKALIISFFHPYCNSGGGGERVIWSAISTILKSQANSIIFIYTNDNQCFKNPESVILNIKKIFNIDLIAQPNLNAIHFIRLRCELFLRPQMYPMFTLVGQALGSILAAIEAIIRIPPDIFIDTTGFAFTLPLFHWLCGSKCGAYVHFPTISCDMENRVVESNSPLVKETGITYNNPSYIRNSLILTNCKLFYYRIFKAAYSLAGSSLNCQVAAVNSTWTLKHINSMWGGHPIILYPPCPVDSIFQNCIPIAKRCPWILSIGQFRPEKNHELQLLAFCLFMRKLEDSGLTIVGGSRLILAGGCRNESDFARVQKLKDLVKGLNLDGSVHFCVNITYKRLKRLLHTCTINLHTMVDEHFGISIVEGMASGLLTVAHRSGGPLTDIIIPSASTAETSPHFPVVVGDNSGSVPVGFLASLAEEYAELFYAIMTSRGYPYLQAIQVAARQRARSLFSVGHFERGWLSFMQRLNS